MNIIRRIAIAILLLSPLGAAAQQSIDSAMKAIENSKSLTNEVYSERRNPESGAIEKASYAFEFTDNKLAEKLIDAIRRERERASSYELVNRHNQSKNVIYTITFDTPKSYAQYTLIQRGESKWMLTVTKSSPKSATKSSTKSRTRSKDRSDIRISTYRDGNENVFININDTSFDIADIASECHTAIDQAIKEMTLTTSDGDVHIYLNGNNESFQNLDAFLDPDDIERLKDLKQLKVSAKSKTKKSAKAYKSTSKSASKSSKRTTRNSSFSSYSMMP